MKETRLARLLKDRIKHILSQRGYTFARMDDLTFLADSVRSDKGTLLSAHGYTRVYSRLFGPIRRRELTFVEMGLLRVDSDVRRQTNAAEGTTAATATRAPSLEMWSTYFPNARVYGFDIDDFSRVRLDRCTIVRGDMSSAADLERLVASVGGPIDVLIDDASHVSHHQQFALGVLFPSIRSGGMYIIEDLHWQDPSLERQGVPKTRDLLRRLQVAGTMDTPLLTEKQRRYIEANLASIELFDSMRDRASTDALAVLVKK